jgi:hypothetical protein
MGSLLRALSYSGLLAAILFFLASQSRADECGQFPGEVGKFPSIDISVNSNATRRVLSVQDRGTEDIPNGFEGGTIIKNRQAYHLFTTEMLGQPDFLHTRLGYWSSLDGLHWTRKSTLFASSEDYTGKDPESALWAPMPVYDPEAQRWNLFYVAYRSKPNVGDAWYGNYDGRIMRATSQLSGQAGIGGPYVKDAPILQPGNSSDVWEGLQGVDSFFPYPAAGGWAGFYGTAHTERKDILWQVGLAAAPHLAGPWKRCTALNPVPLGKTFVENPVVSRIGKAYLAVFDVDGEDAHSIGYAVSSDGFHWSEGHYLEMMSDPHDIVRTPLALIHLHGDSYQLYVTVRQKTSGKASAAPMNAGSIFRFDLHIRSKD